MPAFHDSIVKKERVGGMYNVIHRDGETLLRGPQVIIPADKAMYGDDAAGKFVPIMGVIRWKTAREAKAVRAYMIARGA